MTITIKDGFDFGTVSPFCVENAQMLCESMKRMNEAKNEAYKKFFENKEPKESNVYIVQKDLPCGLKKGDKVTNDTNWSNGIDYKAIITRKNDGCIRNINTFYKKSVVEGNSEWFLKEEKALPEIIKHLRQFNCQNHQHLYCSVEDAKILLGKKDCPNNNGTRTWTFSNEVKGYVTSIEAYNYWFHIIDLSKYKED